MSKLRSLLLLLSMLCLLGGPETLMAEQSSPPDRPLLIRLSGQSFDPLEKSECNQSGAVAESISLKKKTINNSQQGEKYYILQFDGPVRESWKEPILALDAQFFDYVPDFAFIIRCDQSKESQIRASGLSRRRS